MSRYPRDPNLHRNHRSRLRKKALEQGVDCLEDHELLELILFSSVPRVDTNETAHAAINAFGSLGGVLAADPDQLLALPRVGPRSVELLKTLQALCTRYVSGFGVGGRVLSGSDEVVRLGETWYPVRGSSNLCVVCMDSLRRVLKTSVFRVETTTVRARLTQVLREAQATYASSVAVAYVGAGDFAAPTREDRIFYKELISLLSSHDMTLTECVVFSGGKAFAMSLYR